MSAPLHTAVPWRVSKSKARRVTNEHGVIICNAVLRNQGGPKHKSFMKDEHEAEANADLIAAAPEILDELAEARTTISILRTQIMVEIGRGADRWEGVPEKLKERLDAIDAICARATGADA